MSRPMRIVAATVLAMLAAFAALAWFAGYLFALEILAIWIAYLLTVCIGLIAFYGLLTAWSAVLGLWDGWRARRGRSI